MKVSSIIRRILPMTLKNYIRQFFRRNRLIALVSPYLAECTCVDVGASYYPHSKWQFFLHSPNTLWIAVEPNEKNIAYIKSWSWPSKVKTITTGLSQFGGLQTLYVTNVDSGSSLLEPVVKEGMSHRVKGKALDYFFPLQKFEIDTFTLLDVVENASAPFFVKLDTQGTELSILEGAHKLFEDRKILGIEMESTLLAQPIMNGSKKFWEACQYLEAVGFELLDINPIRAPSSKPDSKRYLNECDAVFALRRDVASSLPVNFRVCLFAFYLTNCLYEEAYLLLTEDSEVFEYFTSKKIKVEQLVGIVSSLI